MAHQLTAAARRQLEDTRQAFDKLLADSQVLETVAAVAEQCTRTILAGGKVMFAGNGGSAADAQHLAGEFVSRFNFDRPGIAGLALTTDTSVLTAIGNDYGYEQVFSRQVQALGRSGDVLVGITTSGKSPNILRALEQARESGVIRVGMTGAKGTAMRDLCDYCIVVPEYPTPRVQELHIAIGHAICTLVEESVFRS
ncbi:MAG: D-sedoheptulose 7-phosphate isomerase [Betaproteobacteria bacterium]